MCVKERENLEENLEGERESKRKFYIILKREKTII